MRLIDADALSVRLNDEYDGYMLSENASAIEFDRMIDDAPTIKNETTIHGEWLIINDYVNIGDGTHMECSICHEWKQDRQKTKYCPYCMATMDLN